ncbi:hypothetical protein PSP6_540001 [Paraburkholderia tropica]|uniref:hypothetical protein n=1 Tax=Paraburkholderia tropica TaxID=92647 RepID=UPI001CB1191E|nr:hypothetical protein [Paraburkholderia tropica]CAG9229846.1 hypothetical protein PSP6_540001 [Paraburkholderia tropica]
MTTPTAAPKELTRAQKLTLIYRHTHSDFKGKAGPVWGEHAGKKTIMVNINGAAALSLLDDLTDEQIADKLPYALQKEHQRQEQAAAKKAQASAEIAAPIEAAQEVAETTQKIAVTKITVTRGEGPSDTCRKPETVATYDEANSILWRWSNTAPKNGGYDKCDFVIVFADGSEYRGRYDLKHWSDETANLAGHVQGLALFYTGRETPAHMTQERHQGFLKSEQARETTAAYQKLIDAYDIAMKAVPAPLFDIDG